LKNKKIVFLINSLEGGGAERVVSTLLNNFVDRYDCYLILLDNKISYEIDSKIKLISFDFSYKNGLVKFLSLPLLSYKLIQIIKQYGFTKIVSFSHRSNYINILSKNSSKHKAIISERIAPSSMYSNSSINSIFNKYLTKKLYKRADLIIPVSKAIAQDLENNFDVCKKQNVIYNPYEIDRIKKLSNEKIRIEIDKKNSVISVGSLCKRKNHDLLIKAFSKINNQNAKLYILGRGEEKKNLIKLSKKLSIDRRVIFLGFDNNPYKYLSKSSIFVLSSNSEGFPNVLLEAMVCSCSVISTDCLSGPREILAPSTDKSFVLINDIEKADYGILTPVNDVSNLRNSINMLFENNTLKKQYSKQALIRSRDFSIDKIIKQYESIVCAE
jgi:glycosyltransferase involved in cell wall biosynthesis